MTTPTVTMQLDEAALARLDSLAARSGQSRDAIAAAALDAYVAAELELIESLDEAEAAIERGDFYTQEQMEVWFEERCAARRAD